jgi:hypothetical protein
MRLDGCVTTPPHLTDDTATLKGAAKCVGRIDVVNCCPWDGEETGVEGCGLKIRQHPA